MFFFFFFNYTAPTFARRLAPARGNTIIFLRQQFPNAFANRFVRNVITRACVFTITKCLSLFKRTHSRAHTRKSQFVRVEVKRVKKTKITTSTTAARVTNVPVVDRGRSIRRVLEMGIPAMYNVPYANLFSVFRVVRIYLCTHTGSTDVIFP